MKNIRSPKWSHILLFTLLSTATIAIPASAAPLFQMRLVVAEDLQGSPKDAEKMTVTNRANGQTMVETFWVSRTILIDQNDLEKATVVTSTLATSNVPGRPEIDITFTPKGRERFAEVTRQSINKRLAMIIDGHLISAPVIKTEISGGRAMIAGDFNLSEATDLSRKINEALKK